MAIQTAIDQLKATLDNFTVTVRQQHINWDHKPAPDKWSPKEIMGHLCDSAQINLHRFIRCMYESGFKLVYHQNEWVDMQHYQDADLEDILMLWQLLNKQIIRVLSDYPPDRLQALCDNGRYELSLNTVEFIVYDYVDHLQHHLRQAGLIPSL